MATTIHRDDNLLPSDVHPLRRLVAVSVVLYVLPLRSFSCYAFGFLFLVDDNTVDDAIVHDMCSDPRWLVEFKEEDQKAVDAELIKVIVAPPDLKLSKQRWRQAPWDGFLD